MPLGEEKQSDRREERAREKDVTQQNNSGTQWKLREENE